MIPLVTHGVTAISRLQVWTQPLWLVMLVRALRLRACSATPARSTDLAQLRRRQGQGGAASTCTLFGAALTVGIALITQMGEQVDYLRFMPERTRGQPRAAGGPGVLVGGPGWVVLGVLKMLGGALLAYLAISTWCRPTARSTRTRCTWPPTSTCSRNYGWAVAATALFVVISQLKINVTNAYAGSLAWSQLLLARSRTATRGAWCGWCSTR